ncbi:hypothetical protein ACER0C_004903 [Sarotherodon galilaeus]
MESRVRKRRRSRELPPTFSSLLKTLPESASSFIRTFKRKRPRLRRAMWRLQRMAAEARLMEEKSKKLRVVVLVSAAGGAAALFTGSFSLSLLGALVLCVTGVVTAAGYIKKHFTQKEGSRKDVKTFLRIVEELHRELEEIKKLCEDLQRESVGAETGNIQTLRDDIDELLNSSAKLKLFTGFDSVTELCDHCERAVREFEQMKRRLRDFRGSSDTEMQEDSWRT